MNLTQPSTENVTFMIEGIKDKLRMVNADAMKPEHFERWVTLWNTIVDEHFEGPIVSKRDLPDRRSYLIPASFRLSSNS